MSVFYGASPSEAERFSGRSVFVVGGGNSAGQAAVHLARYARRVTILVRRDALAETMSRYLIDEIEGQPNIDVRYRTEIVDGRGDDARDPHPARLGYRFQRGLLPTPSSSSSARSPTRWLPAEIARPLRLRRHRTREPRLAAWSARPSCSSRRCPGSSPSATCGQGSVKRVASAAGEGSVAIQQVHQYLQLIDSF